MFFLVRCRPERILPRSVARVVRTSGPLPPILIRPTLLSGLSLRTCSAIMFTLSAWASKRDGWKSPLREDSLLSTTIMHAVRGILGGLDLFLFLACVYVCVCMCADVCVRIE